MVTIIIPNYNGESHLRTCIPSIIKQTYREFVLVLVDNGSTDNSIAYVKENLPGSVIIQLKTNTGFAKAVNEGIKYSSGKLNSEIILLLNNDIELDENFLKAGVDTFKNNPDVSFVASKMLNYNDRNIIDDCGDSIRLKGGSPVARGHDEKDSEKYKKEDYVFGVCAGAGFYKKELFDNVGLMDERFIAYYEDFDLSFRAELLGYKAYFQPKAICYHKRGGTSSLMKKGYQTELCERNLVLFRFKNYPLPIYLLYQPLFFFSRLKRIIFFWRDYGFTIFYSAIKGYLRGIFIMPAFTGNRFKIQKNKKVSIKKLSNLFY